MGIQPRRMGEDQQVKTLKVKYNKRFPEWHDRSRPSIVDEDGNVIAIMAQNVTHPGTYDEAADRWACKLVSAWNAWGAYFLDR